MKTVLERAEEVTIELSRLKLKNLKLLRINVADNNPDSGSFRIKGYINKNSFIEIFEFIFSSKIVKYSYSYIKNEKSELRYDNAPHNTNFLTQPNHKHLKAEIQPLELPQISEFIKELKIILELK